MLLVQAQVLLVALALAGLVWLSAQVLWDSRVPFQRCSNTKSAARTLCKKLENEAFNALLAASYHPPTAKV